MGKIDNMTILQTVKDDNLALFSAYIEGKESLCFGRFPLLTLLYMYEADKIIAKYRDVLSGIRKYTIVEEPFELYKKFREIAGKSLRLYRDEEAVVTPIEILAILKKDRLVKKFYNKFYITERAKRNLKAIYKQSHLKVSIDGDNINIAHRPLEYRQRRVYGGALILSSSFAALITILCVLVGGIYGFGIASSPFKIYTEKQLYRALNSGGNYVLAADINITNFKGGIEFTGTLNGDGYILYVDSLPEYSIVETNKGTLKNLNVIYESVTANIETETSLLVTHNEGVINGVNIICVDANFNYVKDANKIISVCGFATNNRGEISDSYILMTAGVTSTGNGEGFISGYTINNSGVIKNCEFVKDSSIVADTVDVAGFVVENKYGSSVYECTNNCVITQTSTQDGWSPTIAGISLTNYGTIEDCINRGSLTNNSDNMNVQANGIVYVGGISAYNYGDIVKCFNSGDINVYSKMLMVYSGGVFAYADGHEKDNKTITARIINCGIKADINVETVDDKAYIFVGGVGGYLCGEITECFSMANILTEYDDKKAFVGTFLGAAKYDTWTTLIGINPRDNYVLNVETTDYHIAAFIYLNILNSYSIAPAMFVDSSGAIQTLEYESQIMAKEVYWSE